MLLLTPLLVVRGVRCRCFSHTVEMFPDVSVLVQALLIWEKEKLERNNEFLDWSYFLSCLSKMLKQKKITVDLFTFPTLQVIESGV